MKKHQPYITQRTLDAITTPERERRGAEARARASLRSIVPLPPPPPLRIPRRPRVTLAPTPANPSLVGFVDDEQPFPMPASEEP